VAWERGIDAFYGAHYAQAINDFQVAQSSYQQHILAPQYISIARAKIAAGEEAVNPTTYVVIGVLLLLSVAGFISMIVMIVRHRSRHHIYHAWQSGYFGNKLQHLLVTPPTHHGR
jgi:hypothetical protein